MAREMAETVLPATRLTPAAEPGPDVRAAAAIVFNPKRIRFSGKKNSQDQRSIASITEGDDG